MVLIVFLNASSAQYVTVGAYSGVTLSVTDEPYFAMTFVVYVTLKSEMGTGIYVADATTSLGAGGNATVFCIDLLPVPAGIYSVTFAAVNIYDQAVSAATIPITLVAP